MNQVLTYSQREGFIYLFAAVVSIFLSWWIYFLSSIVNPDAVCYLLSAEAVGSVGIRGAMQLCGQAAWPFYSALIYSFAAISHAPYVISAYFLDSIFSVISVSFFILIVKELGGSKRILWLAALVILLAHQFNSVREYIVRDHGFWAFYLMSLFFLLRYFQYQRAWMAFAWSASLVVATLFRIEGAFFLLALPLIAWFWTRYSLRQRITCFVTLNLPTIFITLAIAGWLISHPTQTLDKLGRMGEIPMQLQQGFLLIAERFQTMKAALSQHVLSTGSAHEAGLILALTLLSWYVISVISNLSWMYTALVIYGWLHTRPKMTMMLWGYIIINMIITLGFLIEHLFLSKRYLIALSLMFMLWVPFALDDLIEKSDTLRRKLILCLVAMVIFISAMGGMFDFGYSKNYIKQAGNWLAMNAPANAAVYANDYQLMYYSHHFGFDLFAKATNYFRQDAMTRNQWKHYDFIALRINKKEEGETAPLLREMNLTPVQVFSNKRGDQVAIFKISREEKVS